jgi:predicted DsbA family dithiol-disulfide isomerase
VRQLVSIRRPLGCRLALFPRLCLLAAAANPDVAGSTPARFRHYFTDGLYPNTENLVKAATEAGLDADAARAAVNSDERLAAVKAEARTYTGCGGVPFFIVNGEPAFSGAHPPENFLKAFDSAT